MKLSVIICTYNRNSVLCNTIQMLLGQLNDEFEIIVIDQSTTHDVYTTNFLDSITDKIVYVSLETPNLPMARNIGLKKAKADCVLFLDDDVVIENDFIAKTIDAFELNLSIHAFTGLSYSSNGNERDQWSLVPHADKQYSFNAYPTNSIPGYFMAFRKNIIFEIGLFDEWIGTQPHASFEDGEICIRLKLAKCNISVIPYSTLIHLAELNGGCEVRVDYNLNKELKVFNQYRMYLYGLKKNKKLFSRYRYLIEFLRFYKSYYVSTSFHFPRFVKVLLSIIKMNKSLKLR